MSADYTGRKAVISGGTIGVGLAVAKALVAGGAKVLVTGRSEGNIATASAELAPAAEVVRSDATRLSEIAQLADAVRARLGTVDAVFVNAGYASLEPFADVSEQSFDRTFAVNAKGAFFTAQRLAPLVRDGGAFVFTTSVANTTGSPGMAAYSGAKAAVRSFAQVLAAELLPRGIRVNAVSPGFIKTPTMGIAGASPEELAAFEQEGSELTPLGRVGSPDEVASAALFLAFEATFTTGVELAVDGGIAQGIGASSGID